MEQTDKNRVGTLEEWAILWPTITGAVFLIISLIANNFAMQKNSTLIVDQQF